MFANIRARGRARGQSVGQFSIGFVNDVLTPVVGFVGTTISTDTGGMSEFLGTQIGIGAGSLDAAKASANELVEQSRATAERQRYGGQTRAELNAHAVEAIDAMTAILAAMRPDIEEQETVLENLRSDIAFVEQEVAVLQPLLAELQALHQELILERQVLLGERALKGGAPQTFNGGQLYAIAVTASDPGVELSASPYGSIVDAVPAVPSSFFVKLMEFYVDECSYDCERNDDGELVCSTASIMRRGAEVNYPLYVAEQATGPISPLLEGRGIRYDRPLIHAEALRDADEALEPHSLTYFVPGIEPEFREHPECGIPELDWTPVQLEAKMNFDIAPIGARLIFEDIRGEIDGTREIEFLTAEGQYSTVRHEIDFFISLIDRRTGETELLPLPGSYLEPVVLSNEGVSDFIYEGGERGGMILFPGEEPGTQVIELRPSFGVDRRAAVRLRVLNNIARIEAEQPAGMDALKGISGPAMAPLGQPVDVTLSIRGPSDFRRFEASHIGATDRNSYAALEPFDNGASWGYRTSVTAPLSGLEPRSGDFTTILPPLRRQELQTRYSIRYLREPAHEITLDPGSIFRGPPEPDKIILRLRQPNGTTHDGALDVFLPTRQNLLLGRWSPVGVFGSQERRMPLQRVDVTFEEDMPIPDFISRSGRVGFETAAAGSSFVPRTLPDDVVVQPFKLTVRYPDVLGPDNAFYSRSELSASLELRFSKLDVTSEPSSNGGRLYRARVLGRVPMAGAEVVFVTRAGNVTLPLEPEGNALEAVFNSRLPVEEVRLVRNAAQLTTFVIGENEQVSLAGLPEIKFDTPPPARPGERVALNARITNIEATQSELDIFKCVWSSDDPQIRFLETITDIISLSQTDGRCYAVAEIDKGHTGDGAIPVNVTLDVTAEDRLAR
jgi:hypothetical protein